MPGVSLTYDLSGLSRLTGRLERLTRLQRRSLLEVVGATVESQTHRRLRDEKEAPDGTPWADWSERYAATRHGGHSLLMGEGNLDDSIQFDVADNAVEIGSNLVYAAVHQFGSGNEPVQVPAHQRLVTQAFGRELPFGVWANVSAYSFIQNISERPYLGLSPDNETELINIADRWLDKVVGL